MVMMATAPNYHVKTYKPCEGGANHRPGHDRGESGWLCDECWDWLCDFIKQNTAKSELVQIELNLHDTPETVVAPVYKRITVESIKSLNE